MKVLVEGLGFFLELHHVFVWVTARSIFKAFLPGEAWATNCTSEAGQDGIHRSALPLISLPSAANQTHHIAAFCLLITARAKKVNSSSTSLDNNILAPALFCLSLSLFLVRFSLQKIGLNNNKRSLFPESHLSLLTVIRTLMQLCFLHFLRSSFIISVCIHNTATLLCVCAKWASPT